MMGSSKPGNRFLPTLTEVVHLHPDQFAATEPGNQANVEVRIAERAIELVNQQIQPTMDAILQSHLHSFKAVLQQEIAVAVKQAVGQALAEVAPARV